MKLVSVISVVARCKEELSLAMLELDGNISVLSDGFKKRITHMRRKHLKVFLR
jgi:hypothetical protein